MSSQPSDDSTSYDRQIGTLPIDTMLTVSQILWTICRTCTRRFAAGQCTNIIVSSPKLETQHVSLNRRLHALGHLTHHAILSLWPAPSGVVSMPSPVSSIVSKTFISFLANPHQFIAHHNPAVLKIRSKHVR